MIDILNLIDDTFNNDIFDGESFRICNKCDEIKLRTNFVSNKNCLGGRTKECKECYNKHRRELRKDVDTGNKRRKTRNIYRLKNKDKINGHANKLRSFYKYGITFSEKESLFEQQDKRCAICRSLSPNSKLNWCIDHDHLNKRVRGILCHYCNLLVGHLENIGIADEISLNEYQKQLVNYLFRQEKEVTS